MLDLLLQLEDTARAEQVLKSIVESKIGTSRPAIFQWTHFYIGEWLYLTGHGIEGEKFLRLLTDGDGRWVLIPAQRAAAVLLSKIELQQGNVSQSAIWMRRAVIGVFEDKGSGSEEIVDTLTEYAQYLSQHAGSLTPSISMQNYLRYMSRFFPTSARNISTFKRFFST